MNITYRPTTITATAAAAAAAAATPMLLLLLLLLLEIVSRTVQINCRQVERRNVCPESPAGICEFWK